MKAAGLREPLDWHGAERVDLFISSVVRLPRGRQQFIGLFEFRQQTVNGLRSHFQWLNPYPSRELPELLAACRDSDCAASRDMSFAALCSRTPAACNFAAP